MSTTPAPSNPGAEFDRRSVARVATARPARYGKQLAAHMSRKIAASWDEDAATGRLVFARGGPVPAAPGWPRPTPSRLARGGPTETDQSQTGTTTPRLARGGPTAGVVELTREEDRKSTRLNSSHLR